MLKFSQDAAAADNSKAMTFSSKTAETKIVKKNH